ncbi:ABC transporter permease [Occallatibacter savannae]|uniref:ABC transporter permease n=1 Tax=Occallatibacter savannae TaxID=1002691 RepID=UPI000D68BCD1|nr:ABC transporter permease [Occallatibacter savannae]
MGIIKSLITGLHSLFHKRRIESELDDELAAFAEAAASDNQRRGMSPEHARRAALLQTGSRNAVKHQVWSSRWESSLESLLHDLRIGIRGLLKTPAFTIVALASLALGIGANTAIFTLINAVLLRPLPVSHPEQLYLFGKGSWVGSVDDMPNRPWQLFSYPFFKDFSAQTRPFSGIAAQSSIQMGSHIVLGGGAAEQVHIDLVSGSYFNVLEVPPALGRLIGESDDGAPGAGPVAVASWGWFQRHFQGNPGAIGRSVHIQGHDYTIIGVAKPGFTGLAPADPADLWIPLSMQKEISPGWNGLDDYKFQSLYLVGRLKPGMPLTQAAESATLLLRQLVRSEFLGGAGSQDDLARLQRARIDLVSASGGLPGLKLRYTAPLTVLMGIVALVLLIACANIANMLLARGVARARELAVRQALGATRRRIVVQLLTESFLLAGLGAALGTLLAFRGLQLLLALDTQGTRSMPLLDLSPDHRVLGFTLLVTVLTALLFGIAPALRSTRIDLTPTLRDGRGASSASSRGALSRSLIVGQIALSILLLAASGLFLRSLRNLTRVDLGFDPRNVTVFSLDEYSANLPLDARLTQLQQQIEQKVQSLPGVQSAAFSMFTFNQGAWSSPMTAQNVTPNTLNSDDVLYNVIGTQYLQTASIPLLSGRNFTAQDNATSPHVAIVNETLARTFFPNESALGHHVCICDPNAHGQKLDFDIEIIGVVRDAKYMRIGEGQHMAAYFPYSQRVQYFGNFSVKSTVLAASLIPAVRRIIAEVNPQITVAKAEPLSAQVESSIATQRLIGWLSAFFASLAVFLAAIGTYGLISYSVARRTSEIGVRMALGAQAPALLWMVLRESLTLLLAGLLIGIPVSLGIAKGLTSFLQTELFHVSATDPVAFLTASVVVSVMTFAAAWLPARRATKVDPLIALRCE